MEYTIKKLALLAGVSVRTLHYYDQSNLLKPSRLGENGYRYYGKSELVRLQQILFFRELRFSLENIREILESSEYNLQDALHEQYKLLLLERTRLDEIIKTVENTITNQDTMQDNELYDGLSRDQIEEYTKEAKERWGNTQAYKQSQERMKNMSKEELKKISKDQEDNARQLAEHMEEGFDALVVQELIDQQFGLINQHFYDCSLEMFRNLAVMTTEDERYAAYYRRLNQDLPEFRLKATQYYCDTRTK